MWHPGGSIFILQMIFNFLILPVASSFFWISNQNLQASLFVGNQSHVSGCLLEKFSWGNTWTFISVYSRPNLSSSPYSTLLSPPHSAEHTLLHAFTLSEHGTILQLTSQGQHLQWSSSPPPVFQISIWFLRLECSPSETSPQWSLFFYSLSRQFPAGLW